MKPDSICIIGCGGFIGSHLVERFLAKGDYQVNGIDLTNKKISHCLKNERFRYYNVNIKDARRLRPVIEESDCVISLAALCNPSLYNKVPLQVVDVNLIHSLEIVKLCAELDKWLIHFSTSEVYGKTLASFMGGYGTDKKGYYLLREDETPLIMGPIQAQRWIYACSKQLLERIIYAHDFSEGLDYTIIRPFNFIGPRMDYIPGIEGNGVPRVLACFTGSLLLRKPLKLVDGGLNMRTFTYIQDAVNALELMIEKPKKSKGQVFNIGNPGNETTIRDLARLMVSIYTELLPSEKEFEFPLETVTSKEFYGAGYEDSDRRVPDITKARTLLGWEPKVGLEHALRETLEYYIRKFKHPQRN